MEKIKKKKINFTEGAVFFKLLLFILPIIATNLLQTFYNAADMIVVSLSDEKNAVGAIGVTGSFINLVINVFIGFSVGANVVVAKRIGAKDKEGAQNAVHTAILMAVIFGFIGMALGISISRPVLRAMGAKGNLLDLAVKYTYIYFLGVPFLALTNYLIAIFRAKGDSKTPLVVLSLSGLLNVGLNLFLVLVVGFSVEGVAIATACANIVSFIALLWKLKKDQDYTTFSARRLMIERDSFREIVINGVPAGIQGALFSLSNLLIQSSIVKVNNSFVPEGTDYAPVVNGSSAAANIEGFIYMAMNAVYQGAITVTSQNMGAKKPHRVKRILYSCLLTVFFVGMITGGLAYILKQPLLSLYGVKEAAEGSLEALEMTAAMVRFRLIVLVYFLCGWMDVCSGVLRGMGRAVVSTIISLIGACLFRLVWLWTVFPIKPTLEVIFISYPISWVLTTAVSFTVIQRLLKRINRQADVEQA
jgi:putative MATE family efflux protein